VAFSDLIVGISFSIEIQVSLLLLHVLAFGSVAEPPMPSADFCQSILSPLDDSSTRLIDRSPRVMRTFIHAYACHINVQAFRVGIGL
jgi:hypothetical protein